VKWVAPSVMVSMRALGAFDQHLHGTVGQLQHLQNIGHAADLVDVCGGGFVLGGGLLGCQHDALALFHGRFQRLDGFGTTDEQRYHHMREHNHIAQRQEWQRRLLG